MTISEQILQILQEVIPFDGEKSDEYYNTVYDAHSKISALLPMKTGIISSTVIKPNTPLWLWRTGSKEPVLANFRTDYPEPCFWEIVDGDYINNSNVIPMSKATHFMYINGPED